MSSPILVLHLLAGLAATLSPQQEPARGYVCMRAPSAPTIDGHLDDEAWRAAAWSEDFIDIEGEARPRPPFRTRVRMLWDDQFLYIAAELAEPNVWGTLTERDAVIYHDDDFEVFIDPDGDTHNYYELEINALGTVWDLMLLKPYRDGGPAIDSWDIAGLRSAVAVDGSINDARDTDRGWTVELALPWSVLEEAAPGGRPPRDGEQWRINFSRVDWDMDSVGRDYVKRLDPTTGRPLAEHNWVWSPQGAIDMHRPEKWGIVQFSDLPAGQPAPPFVAPADEDVRDALREVYHAQRAAHRQYGRFTADLQALDLPPSVLVALHGFEMTVTIDSFDASATGTDSATVWRIREDGRIWRQQ